MATLTVKVIEEITLNNNSYNSERSLDISSVDEIVKRIVTISTTETGLLGFATASSTDLSKSYLVEMKTVQSLQSKSMQVTRLFIQVIIVVEL